MMKRGDNLVGKLAARRQDVAGDARADADRACAGSPG